MKGFDYVRPNTILEAVSFLAGSEGLSKPIAGGTDLLVSVKKGLLKPSLLVDINGLDGLKGATRMQAGVEQRGTRTARTGLACLHIGALTRIDEIERDEPGVFGACEALRDAAGVLGTPQVRAMGTIGGNLCNASPAADMAPPLMVLDAVLHVVRPNRPRELHKGANGSGSLTRYEIPMDEFFLGPGRTRLGPADILEGISFPVAGPRSGSRYVKFTARNAADMAMVGIAVSLRLDPSLEVCEEVKIALGAVAPTPIRAYRAEAVLSGSEAGPAALREAGKVAADEAAPITDLRASADYRKHLIRALLPEAVQSAMKRAKRRASMGANVDPEAGGGLPK